MKTVFTHLLLLLCSGVIGQSLQVSGRCMSGTITLDKQPANTNGKPAYTGQGTVLGTNNVAIAVYWMGAPDNVWVLAFSGQPYFFSTCPSPTPPATTNAGCPAWQELYSSICTGATPLSITGTGTLPVSLVNFKAQRLNKSVLLSWATTSESNNRGFYIQRSADGNSWTSLDFVEGKGNATTVNNYTFEDVAPLQTRAYYRLQQTDLDGRFAHSPVLTLEATAGRPYMLQPMRNGNYQLQINMEGKTQVLVADLQGKVLGNSVLGAGAHVIELSRFAAGTYVIRVLNAQLQAVERVIKR